MRSVRKVIHVTGDFSSAAGGLATAVAELTRALGTRGVHSEIVSPKVEQDLAPQGVRVHSLTASNPRLSSVAMAAYLRQQARHGAIVHVHGLWNSPQLQAAKLARQLGVPWVLTPHNMLGGWLFNRSRWKMLKKIAYLKGPGKALLSPNSIHFLSDSERDRAKSFFSDKTDYCVVPNALNLSHSIGEEANADAQTHSQLLSLTGNSPYFLYLGRLYEGKGVEELLRAFARSDLPTFRLVLAGQASAKAYETSLYRLVSRLKLTQRVVFAGHVGGTLKGLLLMRAQATCLISYSEGVSFSALESLKFGTPLIATGEVGIPHLETHGSLQVTTDIGDISNALTLAAQWAGEEREARGKASRKRCETRFDWSVLVDRYSEWYEKSLRRTAR